MNGAGRRRSRAGSGPHPYAPAHASSDRCWAGKQVCVLISVVPASGLAIQRIGLVQPMCQRKSCGDREEHGIREWVGARTTRR